MAQSESKARFFDRLTLSEAEKSHRDLYDKMKAEATAGWERSKANRDSLLPHLRNDPRVVPPYAYGQIDEDAIQAEVVRIRRDASPETRFIYNVGCDYEGDREENWIIRWLLWHSFRYRDERNAGSNRKRAPVDAKDVRSGDVMHSSGGVRESSGEIEEADLTPATTIPTTLQASPGAQSLTSTSDTQSTLTTESPSQQPLPMTRFFDPVRDHFREHH